MILDETFWISEKPIEISSANSKTVKTKIFDLAGGNETRFTQAGTSYPYDGTDHPVQNRHVHVKLWVGKPGSGSGGTLKVAIKHADALLENELKTPSSLGIETSAIPVASLTAGTVIFDLDLPQNTKRFIQFELTGGGTLDGGTVFGVVTPID